ncbi:MAG: hypothetical protein LC769_03170, partial [Chloroflexi bacterium]|nr:hypothetical protein [Chloroflexota bacterium]
LTTIREVAERPEQLRDREYRDAVIRDGVSANLCDALIGMNKSTADTGLEFGLTWSSTLSTPDAPRTIYLPASLTPAIAKIAEQLNAISQKDYELRGQVVKLERERRDRVGVATIKEVVEGDRQRRVRVQLNDEDYARALQANQEGRPVICYGTLTTEEGHRPMLKDPRGFHLMETNWGRL